MYSLLDPLDCQCSLEHIYKIASLDYNLKAVAKRLIGPQQAHDIIDQEELSEQDKRDEVFEQWLKVKGSEATYKELVALFETLKFTEAAKAVRMMVTSNAQSDGNEFMQRALPLLQLCGYGIDLAQIHIDNYRIIIHFFSFPMTRKRAE